MNKELVKALEKKIEKHYRPVQIGSTNVYGCFLPSIVLAQAIAECMPEEKPTGHNLENWDEATDDFHCGHNACRNRFTKNLKKGIK